jgi:hypothetical protein
VWRGTIQQQNIYIDPKHAPMIELLVNQS